MPIGNRLRYLASRFHEERGTRERVLLLRLIPIRIIIIVLGTQPITQEEESTLLRVDVLSVIQWSPKNQHFLKPYPTCIYLLFILPIPILPIGIIDDDMGY